MQHNKLKISIVMPVFNRYETVEKAIRSVIDQNYPNLEFIIIDGGSTDGTVDIIKKYENHLTYWHSKKDGSSAVASNMGIEMATGDYVALLMGDDWYEPDTFSKLEQAYYLNSKADIFTFGSRVVEYDVQAANYKTLQLHATKNDLELSFYNICFAHSAICCRFIKKDFYKRIGLFSPFNAKGQHVFSNDKEFLLRAVINNAVDIFIDHMGYNYLAHAGSPSFNNSRKSIMRLCEEHMEIAATFPTKNKLSNKQKLLLVYWYNDQSIRLMLYQMLEGDVRSVMTTIKNELYKINVIWPMVFLYTMIAIFVKRSWRLIFTGRVTKS